jgi:hypothetical protein
VEYRRFLFDHLLDVVLRHWDVRMRELGAESLRLICAYDLDGLIPVAITKMVCIISFIITRVLSNEELGSSLGLAGHDRCAWQSFFFV